MKKYVLIITIIFGFMIFFSACKKNSLTEIENRPYAEYTGDFDQSEIRIRFPENEVKFVDDYSSPTYDGQLTVTVFGPVPTAAITVSYEVMATSPTQEDTHFTLGAGEFVIPSGSLTGAIKVSMISAELASGGNPLLIKLTGTSVGIIDTNFVENAASLFKDCVTNIDVFTGTFTSTQHGGPVLISNDGETKVQILDNIWWDTDDEMNFILASNGTLTPDPDFLTDGVDDMWINDDCNAYGSYGRIMGEDITGGITTNNCDPIFEFICTPTLPDSGYWWGGAYTFKFTLSGGKWVMESDFDPNRKPVKDPR